MQQGSVAPVRLFCIMPCMCLRSGASFASAAPTRKCWLCRDTSGIKHLKVMALGGRIMLGNGVMLYCLQRHLLARTFSVCIFGGMFGDGNLVVGDRCRMLLCAQRVSLRTHWCSMQHMRFLYWQLAAATTTMSSAHSALRISEL